MALFEVPNGIILGARWHYLKCQMALLEVPFGTVHKAEKYFSFK
jgi:hypothetical protein